MLCNNGTTAIDAYATMWARIAVGPWSDRLRRRRSSIGCHTAPAFVGVATNMLVGVAGTAFRRGAPLARGLAGVEQRGRRYLFQFVKV